MNPITAPRLPQCAIAALLVAAACSAPKRAAEAGDKAPPPAEPTSPPRDTTAGTALQAMYDRLFEIGDTRSAIRAALGAPDSTRVDHVASSGESWIWPNGGPFEHPVTFVELSGGDTIATWTYRQVAVVFRINTKDEVVVVQAAPSFSRIGSIAARFAVQQHVRKGSNFGDGYFGERTGATFSYNKGWGAYLHLVFVRDTLIRVLASRGGCPTGPDAIC